MTVQDVAAELRNITGSFSKELLATDPKAAARKPAPDTWAPKEVLGHLIDSAANNHQRFVRAQQGPLTIAGYEQNHWVKSQGYIAADWPHLILLWTHLNLHLADVIARMPSNTYATPMTIGTGPPVTLEFVIVDYLRHLQHHVEQIRQRLTA